MSMSMASTSRSNSTDCGICEALTNGEHPGSLPSSQETLQASGKIRLDLNKGLNRDLTSNITHPPLPNALSPAGQPTGLPVVVSTTRMTSYYLFLACLPI